MNALHLKGVPMPLLRPPTCDLREVDRYTTANGCTLIEYDGADGQAYHELISTSGTTWLVTYR
jgi:hypothetical protein